MILVRTENNHKTLIVECDAGIASEVLYAFSSFKYTVDRGDNNKCICRLNMDDIDAINECFAGLDHEIKLDKTFIQWKDKVRGKSPILIRSATINSRLYKSSDFDIPHKEIKDVLKYFFKPAVNQKSYKDGKWDGYIHLYDQKTRQFPTGLMDRVLELLDKKGVPYKIEYLYDRTPKRQFNWEPKDLFTLSEDQVDCIEACIKAGRCVVKAATGFGKTSALARYLTARHGVPTLFIANKKVLLDDAAKDFAEGIDGLSYDDIAQIKDGMFGKFKIKADTKASDIPDLTQPVVVATIQSLAARLNDERTRPILLKWLRETCKFLQVDETQAVGTKQWDDVLNEIWAPYRVFLSATPKRTDGATLKIFAYAGPLVFDTSAAEQIEKGRLCDLDIQYWPYDHKLYNDNDKELVYNEVYQQCIVDNVDRNDFIVERTLELLDEERPTLVLIQYIEHGHLLKEKFLERGIDIEDIRFVWGQTSDKKRQEAINEFREGAFKILIGSTVADAGLNIPAIAGVVLCGAGNSDITHIQRIGRGSRTFDYKKNWGCVPKFMLSAPNGEKVTRVIDILDDNVAFFKKQAKNRYYNACEEFGADRVHIVGADRTIFRHRSKKKQDVSNVDDGEAIAGMFSAFQKGNRAVIDEFTAREDKAVDNFLSAWKL